MSQGAAVELEQRKSNCEKSLDREEEKNVPLPALAPRLTSSATLYSWVLPWSHWALASLMSGEGLRSMLRASAALSCETVTDRSRQRLPVHTVGAPAAWYQGAHLDCFESHSCFRK